MSDRLSILLLVPTFPPDQCGVGDYTYQLALHLHGRGHRVTVLSTRRDEPRRDLPFEFLPRLANWHFPDMQTILDLVAERRPDIVHIQYHNEDYDRVEMISTLPLCLKEMLPGTRVVTTLHNTRSFTFAPRLTMGVFLRFSDWLVVTNDSDREILVQEYPLHAHKYSVIPAAGGMPCPAELLASRAQHRARLRRELGLEEGEMLLAYFGFINEEKGLESLLYAMAELQRVSFPVRLLLVGGLHSDREEAISPYHQKLLGLIQDLGVAPSIHVTGYLDGASASRHLLAADLAVLPFRDGLTTKRSSFLSVLSHDVPALSTAGEHLPEALRHRENVYLVPAADAETTGRDLALAVQMLGGDRSLMNAIRDGGKALFDDVYAWDPVARAHEEVYARTRGSLRGPETGAVTQKLVSRREASEITSGLRRHGKTIVLAGGCFDILHVGHIRYLRAAKTAGDCLVVGLNSDSSVRALKGPERPLLDERERAEILSEFGFVDYVVVFHEETAEELLRELRPHFYAKGTDYAGQEVPGTTEFLRQGGRMLFVGDDKTRSSSGYLDRMR